MKKTIDLIIFLTLLSVNCQAKPTWIVEIIQSISRQITDNTADSIQIPEINEENMQPPTDTVEWTSNNGSLTDDLIRFDNGNTADSPKYSSDPTVLTSSPTIKNLSKKSYRLPTGEEGGCGYSNASFTRVVGGVPAKLGSWPWMALLGYKGGVGGLEWKCGGSLITTRHVLTAAHCLRSTLSTVRLGEHDLNSTTETHTIDIPIIKVSQYPEYDRRDGQNDLSILYLERDVDLSWKIQPICIPKDDPLRTKDFTGYRPFIAGWGKTHENGTSASILQELQIPVLENNVCKDRYQTVGKFVSEKQFDDAVLCAGTLTGGKDSCQGDSGGPLMAPEILNGEPIFYQIGIVSYGIGCARVDIPGIYCRVQKFTDWIAQQVADPI